MKRIILLLLIGYCSVSNAQVGVNTTNPKALLEIKSTNQATPANTDGLLIPKIDTFPATNPTVDQNGMMVYLTTDVGANLKGFYYWDNATTTWKSFGGDKGWALTGNAGTTATNFIGTTDDKPLKFRINNEKAGLIENENLFNYSNTAFGYQSLNYNTGGNKNVAIGFNALKYNTWGEKNVATGYKSMYNNDEGANNVANGYQSLFSNINGSYNQAIGFEALYNNTDGTGNNAVGNRALFSNVAGNSNTALGNAALYNNTVSGNTAVGNESLFSNTTGYYNTANGFQSLYSNTTGRLNTANGGYALYSNTTGNDNTAIGFQSLFLNTTGYGNVANGSYTLINNLTGAENVANGFSALYANTTGYHNVANGTIALTANTTGNNNVANGHAALSHNTTGGYNVANGSYSLYSNTIGQDNVANGYSALYSNTTGSDNVANGYSALYSNTTGNYNVATGFQSLRNNTTGNYNVANGTNTLVYNHTGSNNVAIGYSALYANITGNNNVANGINALFSNLGSNNVANGSNALNSNTTGNNNVANGSSALAKNTNGNSNVATGFKSLLRNTIGSGNSANGEEANPTTTTGWNNIGIGYHSLGNVDSNENRVLGNEIGYDNIGIGLAAGDRAGNNINGCLFLGAFANVTNNDTNLTNATAIGRYATVSQDNSLVLGAINGVNNATANTKVGIGNTNPTTPLEVTNSGTSEIKISSTSGFGAGRLSFVSDRGLASQWRPGYIESGDNGGFTGRLDFYTNIPGEYEVANNAMSIVNKKVGIGTSNPFANLDVRDLEINDVDVTVFSAKKQGTVGSTWEMGSVEYYTEGYGNFGFSRSLSPIGSNGSADLGSSLNTKYDGYRWGTLYCTLNPNVSSDITLKKEVKPLQYGLESIRKINPISYIYKSQKLPNGEELPDDEKTKMLGFSAQELQQIIPEVVSDSGWKTTDEKTYHKEKTETLGVRYGDLIPVAFNAIKELDDKIEKISKENDLLVKKNEELEIKNISLEQRLKAIEEKLSK